MQPTERRANNVTNLEKENLEAHVDLCALRYSYLEEKLERIDAKLDALHADIMERNQKFPFPRPKAAWITGGFTVLAAIITGIIVLIVNM